MVQYGGESKSKFKLARVVEQKKKKTHWSMVYWRRVVCDVLTFKI